MTRTLLAVVVAACTTKPTLGPPTGAECPQDSTLTYQSFAKPFMATYCNDCHSTSKMGADRHGAPSLHDFDTLFGIKAVAPHVEETSAAGPKAFNDSMPPADDYDKFPTSEERYQLGEWIACGYPDPL